MAGSPPRFCYLLFAVSLHIALRGSNTISRTSGVLSANGKAATCRDTSPFPETGVVAHRYWIELAALEKTVFAFEPMSLIVPTTSTKITASITAYSAISWPSSSDHNLQRRCVTVRLLSKSEVESVR